MWGFLLSLEACARGPCGYTVEAMKRSEILFGLLRIPIDVAAAFAAILLAYRLRQEQIDLIPGVQLLEPATTLPVLRVYTETFAIPATVAFLAIVAALGLYALLATRSAWSEIGRLLLGSLLWLTVVIAWFFLVQKELFYSRILLVHATAFIAVFSVTGRVTVLLLQRSFLRSGIGARRVVSIGRQKPVTAACDVLTRDVRYAYAGHYLSFSDVRAFHERRGIDLILQTDPDPVSSETNELIEYCRSEHIAYAFLPPVLGENPHQLRIDHLGLVPMLAFRPTPLDGWGRVLKRLFDFAVSLALLIVFLPLLCILCVCCILFQGFPVFYVSRRVGESGRGHIPALKFRTMVRNADSLKPELVSQSHRGDGPLFKVKNDPRVTPMGRVLRHWSLDELPQLLNVLAGHMSLVGPRPHLPAEVGLYSRYDRRVFAVKPGITGLAQVSGRSDLPFAEEVRLDLRYIEEWSPLLDLWILWRTLIVVVERRGAD